MVHTQGSRSVPRFSENLGSDFHNRVPFDSSRDRLVGKKRSNAPKLFKLDRHNGKGKTG